MKQNLITKSILTLVMLVMSVSVWAWDKDVNVDGLHYFLYYESHTATVGGGICNSLRGSVEVPSEIIYNGVTYTVTKVGGSGFAYSAIDKVVLPSTITEIEDDTFRDCKELTSIDLGNSVKSIGGTAFIGCEKLTSITGYESVESLGYHVFNYEVPWVSNQPDGVVYFGKVLLKYNGFMPPNTTINIKEGTLQIKEEAFMNCTNLVAVTMPNTIAKIETRAFERCTALASISIPQSDVEIEASAFARTKWLESQPDGVVYINNMAYTYKGYMPKETSINIKNGTTTIAEYAFSTQNNLTSINIPNSVTYIGESAFERCIYEA